MHRDQVGPAAVRQHGGDPVAGVETGAVRGLAHHPGEVDAELEGEVGLDLVLAPAQQQVGPADAQRMHLDQHLSVAAVWLVGLHHLDA